MITTTQFTAVQPHIVQAAAGQDLIDVATVSFTVDGFIVYWEVDAIDVDTGEKHFLDSGTNPGVFVASKTEDWPLQGINDFMMPNRTLNLQLRLFLNFSGSPVSFYNLPPIVLAQPLTIHVSDPNGTSVSNATVTLYPKDPKLAFTDRVSYTYVTDTNGNAVVQLTGGVVALQQSGAAITAYVPQSTLFSHMDNAAIQAGKTYTLKLIVFDPNNPPIYRVIVTYANAVGATLSEILNLIGTPIGFKLVKAQVQGNSVLLDVQPIASTGAQFVVAGAATFATGSFGWGPFLAEVIGIVILLIILAAIISWGIVGPLNTISNTVGGQIFLAGAGIALIAGGFWYFTRPGTIRRGTRQVRAAGRAVGGAAERTRRRIEGEEDEDEERPKRQSREESEEP